MLAKKACEDAEAEKRKEVYNLAAGPSNEKVQTTLKEAMSVTSKWPSGSDKHKDVIHKLLVWICDSMQPYTTVSNVHFINFMEGECWLQVNGLCYFTVINNNKLI